MKNPNCPQCRGQGYLVHHSGDPAQPRQLVPCPQCTRTQPPYPLPTIFDQWHASLQPIARRPRP